MNFRRIPLTNQDSSSSLPHTVSGRWDFPEDFNDGSAVQKAVDCTTQAPPYLRAELDGKGSKRLSNSELIAGVRKPCRT
jgi:hypothetical protein